MVAVEAVITGFVIAFMVVIMGVMVYFAFATEDDERSEPDDPAAEAVDTAE
jgi:heme/copper-type cytochrome/quinol oxidase subunit 2